MVGEERERVKTEWQSRAGREGENRGRSVGEAEGRGERRRGGCSVFIHLLISPPYLKAFHLSEHPSIHPPLHSFSRQSSRASIHPPIYRCGRHPPFPPNHASISLSIFPFPPFRPLRLLSISPSLRLRLTLSPLLPSFIYIVFFTPFQKNTVGEKGFGGAGPGRKLGQRVKDSLMSGCAAIGVVEGFFGGLVATGGWMPGRKSFSFSQTQGQRVLLHPNKSLSEPVETLFRLYLATVVI